MARRGARPTPGSAGPSRTRPSALTWAALGGREERDRRTPSPGRGASGSRVLTARGEPGTKPRYRCARLLPASQTGPARPREPGMWAPRPRLQGSLRHPRADRPAAGRPRRTFRRPAAAGARVNERAQPGQGSAGLARRLPRADPFLATSPSPAERGTRRPGSPRRGSESREQGVPGIRGCAGSPARRPRAVRRPAWPSGLTKRERGRPGRGVPADGRVAPARPRAALRAPGPSAAAAAAGSGLSPPPRPAPPPPRRARLGSRSTPAGGWERAERPP